MAEPLWTLGEIAKAARGTRLGRAAAPVSGCSIDSRSLVPGDAFVAIRGPNRDGHTFVAAALEKGAACAIVDNTFPQADEQRLVRVGDTLEALNGLGHAARERARTTKVIAVTGSNGKSTTTALIHHILKAAGRRTQMGGNIGRGVLDLDPPEPGEIVVVELSSYQIELARTLAPDVAVFLNLSPDPLERHGGIGGYFAAKQRLFEAGAPERSVIGIDEAEGRYLAGRAEQSITVSVETRLRGQGWSVFMHKSHLTEWRRGKQMAAIDLRPALALKGAHNHQNACAAYAACRAAGLGPRQIEGGLSSFPGLAHRMERVGEAAGIVFINDSKATNADAAEKALLAFENIRWIAGGRPKEGGIELLRPLFGKIAKAYLIGEAEAEFAATLGGTPHARCGTLAEAVDAARADARPGRCQAQQRNRAHPVPPRSDGARRLHGAARHDQPVPADDRRRPRRPGRSRRRFPRRLRRAA